MNEQQKGGSEVWSALEERFFESYVEPEAAAVAPTDLALGSDVDRVRRRTLWRQGRSALQAAFGLWVLGHPVLLIALAPSRRDRRP